MTPGDSGGFYISGNFRCFCYLGSVYPLHLSGFEFSLKVGNLGRFAANKSMKLPTRASRAQVISSSAEGKQADTKQMGRVSTGAEDRIDKKNKKG